MKKDSGSLVESVRDLPGQAVFNKPGTMDINEAIKLVVDKYELSHDPKDYAFIVLKALHADKPNENGDAFPLDELKRDSKYGCKVYQTFILKPHFVEHNQEGPARGFILDAHLEEPEGEDAYVELVVAVDTKKDPIYGAMVKANRIKTFSMGCTVGETECSICKNRAASEEKFCTHVKDGKMQTFKVSKEDGTEEDQVAFERCYEVCFDEISGVGDPADKGAKFEERLARQKRRVTRRVANVDPSEIDRGDYVDCGPYGKHYVVNRLKEDERTGTVWFWITDDIEERFNPKAEGHSIAHYDIEKIIEKASDVDNEDDDGEEMEASRKSKRTAGMKRTARQAMDELMKQPEYARDIGEDEDVKLQQVYTQYIHQDNDFRPAGKITLKERLASCPYEVNRDLNGLFFTKVKPLSDEIINFDNSVMASVVAEVDKFWDSKEKYAQLGLTHNRGILLYGPPGTGKSICLQQVANLMAKRGDVVFFVKNASSIIDALKAFREVEPDRKVVVAFEEADEFCDGYNERDMLRVMDGDAKIAGVLFLATTNYIERLPPRMLRPGRFDRKVFVDYPDYDSRFAYLDNKLSRLNVEKDEIKNLAKQSEGLGFGHLRELVTGVYAIGEQAETVLASLKTKVAGLQKEAAMKRSAGKKINEQKTGRIKVKKIGNKFFVISARGNKLSKPLDTRAEAFRRARLVSSWKRQADMDLKDESDIKTKNDLGELVPARLNKKLNLEGEDKLTKEDYQAWLEDWNPKFETAVNQFLGEDKAEEYLMKARLDDYLLYRLGLGPEEAGGVSFTDKVSRRRRSVNEVGEPQPVNAEPGSKPEDGWVNNLAKDIKEKKVNNYDEAFKWFGDRYKRQPSEEEQKTLKGVTGMRRRSINEDEIVRHVQDNAKYYEKGIPPKGDHLVVTYKGKKYFTFNDTRDLVLQIARDEGLDITARRNKSDRRTSMKREYFIQDMAKSAEVRYPGYKSWTVTVEDGRRATRLTLGEGKDRKFTAIVRRAVEGPKVAEMILDDLVRRGLAFVTKKYAFGKFRSIVEDGMTDKGDITPRENKITGDGETDKDGFKVKDVNREVTDEATFDKASNARKNACPASEMKKKKQKEKMEKKERKALKIDKYRFIRAGILGETVKDMYQKYEKMSRAAATEAFVKLFVKKAEEEGKDEVMDVPGLIEEVVNFYVDDQEMAPEEAAEKIVDNFVEEDAPKEVVEEIKEDVMEIAEGIVGEEGGGEEAKEEIEEAEEDIESLEEEVPSSEEMGMEELEVASAKKVKAATKLFAMKLRKALHLVIARQIMNVEPKGMFKVKAELCESLINPAPNAKFAGLKEQVAVEAIETAFRKVMSSNMTDEIMDSAEKLIGLDDKAFAQIEEDLAGLLPVSISSAVDAKSEKQKVLVAKTGSGLLSGDDGDMIRASLPQFGIGKKSN